ncbi:MAG: copper transporter [Actinomycetota bacterium]
MISWRYHLVSIVAVFLALGLGILVGTTVLNDSLVNSLRTRTETLQGQTSDLRDQLDAAVQRSAGMDRFAADVQPFLLAGRLLGQPLVVVTVDGADGGALDETAAVLDRSGARLITTITLQPAIVPDGEATGQDLARLLGLPADTSPEDLMTATADALAERLAQSPPRAATGDDLLGQLLSSGFVVAPGLSDADLASVGGPGQVIVVIGGASAASKPATAGLLTPLVADLVDRQMTTVAAEASDRTSTFVSSLTDTVGSAALVTVDGLDQPIGGSALVLGIARSLETGEGGAFGVGDQSSQTLPDPPA